VIVLVLGRVVLVVGAVVVVVEPDVVGVDGCVVAVEPDEAGRETLVTSVADAGVVMGVVTGVCEPGDAGPGFGWPALSETISDPCLAGRARAARTPSEMVPRSPGWMGR
jgi:hypothetical protein